MTTLINTFPRPLRALPNAREMVRQFTPNWFTATMGTGVVALALARLPSPFTSPALLALAEGFWWFAMGLFLICTALYAARWWLFPQEARRIFGHSAMCMFFGAMPMGLATIVNGFLVFGIPRWGDAALDIAQALWWVDAGLAVACGVGVPYLMFTRQEHRLEGMTAIWLLPVVACEVTAASAGLLLARFPVEALTGGAARQLLFLGYALWGMSVLPALGILAVLFLRLVLHKLPPREMAVSCWLSLGPLGTGALGLLTLGDAAPGVLAGHDPLGVGTVARAVGVFGACLLWGYGLWWLALAGMITLRYARSVEGMPFNMGWWGFTFPLGVFALATLGLAAKTGAGFFEALGVGFVGGLVVLWVMVAARTVHGAYHGHLFHSPCIAGLEAAMTAPTPCQLPH